MYFKDERIQSELEDVEIPFFDIEKERNLCNIFSEIDEKYNYLFEQTLKNEKIPEPLFSFSILNKGEEGPLIAGIFPTIDECNIYRKKIEDLDEFINKCKIYKSIFDSLEINSSDKQNN